jgi:hypothetical protein
MPLGCSIAQHCPCATSRLGQAWKNHGEYVTCIQSQADRFANENGIGSNDIGPIVSTAAKSGCGSKK